MSPLVLQYVAQHFKGITINMVENKQLIELNVYFLFIAFNLCSMLLTNRFRLNIWSYRVMTHMNLCTQNMNSNMAISLFFYVNIPNPFKYKNCARLLFSFLYITIILFEKSCLKYKHWSNFWWFAILKWWNKKGNKNL